MFSRRNFVMPGEACKNCANYDPQIRCPQQMKDQVCTSFEIVDPGDIDVVEEKILYTREALGSADVKQSKTPIEPPTDEVDVHREEEEEVEEDV